MTSNQPFFTDTSTTILPTLTANSGTINVYPQQMPAQGPSEPKRLSDREWLDAEVEAVCALAA